MSDLEKVVQQTLAVAQYLSWADLQKTLFEVEMDNAPTEPSEVREHERRWFALMCYWYASLHVVLEAWDELKFSDPVIDRLLAHPKDFRNLLRRYRNGVFHFQRSVVDPRITDLLQLGAAHVYWVLALHDELVRFFSEHLGRQVATEEQLSEFRDGIESIVNWFPYREPAVFESLDGVLSRGRDALARYPDDRSEQRKEVVRSLECAEATLLKGRRDWAALRAQILREAGIE